MVSLLNLLITCIFALRCSGFVCPRSAHTLSGSRTPARSFGLSNGTTQYATPLTGPSSSGQTLNLYFHTGAGALDQPVDRSGSFSLGVAEILSFTLSHSANGSAAVELHYGEFFRGIKDATYNFQNNVTSGDIDGRALNPFGASSLNTTLNFIDGHGLPNVQIAAELTASNLNASLQDLQSKILSNDSCNTLAARTVTPNGLTLNALYGRQGSLDYNQIPGHSSNTDGSFGCIECLTEEALVVNAGIGACVGICSFLWFSSDCPNCWNNLNNLDNSLNQHCIENFCCPVDCGVACCDLGESCLSGASGLCCSGGESPCGGKTCCASDQTCMGDGSCCPSTAVIGGECCPQVGLCGSACCGLLLDCMEPGLCCAPGSVLDGGICCEANQYNDSGICCNVGTALCGSSGCCPGTCENGVCVSTSNGCQAAGGSGATCNTAADCPAQGVDGINCSQGCCFYTQNIP